MEKMTPQQMITTIKALTIRVSLLEKENEEITKENEKLINIIDELNGVIFSMGKRGVED